MEILYQPIQKEWICMVLEYQFCFFDQLLFNLPLWEKTSTVRLVEPERILKRIPMIPDFSSCLQSEAVGIHPSPVWLRTHSLLHSPALEDIYRQLLTPQTSDSESSVNGTEEESTASTSGITNVSDSTNTTTTIDDLTSLMSSCSLSLDYVKTTEPQVICSTLSELSSLSESMIRAEAAGASALIIRIRAQLLEAIQDRGRENLTPSRSKRVRRAPERLDDYERY